MDQPENQPDTAAVAVTAAPPAAPNPAPEFEKISIDYFMKVKLRIALIEAAEAIPKSKKLLKLQLDVGPEIGKRQILAGVAQFYPPETLVGKKIIIVANLLPAQLMGVESQGMLLAASTPTVDRLILVDPGQDMPPGCEVR